MSPAFDVFSQHGASGLESTAPGPPEEGQEVWGRPSPASNPLPSAPRLGTQPGPGQWAGRQLSRCRDSEPPPGRPAPAPAHTPPPIKGRGPSVGSPQGVSACRRPQGPGDKHPLTRDPLCHSACRPRRLPPSAADPPEVPRRMAPSSNMGATVLRFKSLVWETWVQVTSPLWTSVSSAAKWK